jgi:uncharacterized protein (UPF0332 family)
MNQFIKTLVKEGKIKQVEPSKEIFESYSQKSRNALQAAEILAKQNLLEEATSMTYYAMYNKVTALFYLAGIKCENHAGAIILFKEVFGLDNAELEKAKKERIDKQYYTDFKITHEQVKQQIRTTKDFLDHLSHFIDRLTEEAREKYRQKLEKYF